jgi:homoserine O-acetyltransferase/O-succinyltransferase
LGDLNEAKTLQVAITSWYSGTHQIWRDVYTGFEHALNPSATSSSTRSAAA